MQYASRAQTQLAPLHAAHHLMGMDPTLKTQLHLRQAFPVILSKRWSGMHTHKTMLIQINIRNQAKTVQLSVCFTVESDLLFNK